MNKKTSKADKVSRAVTKHYALLLAIILFILFAVGKCGEENKKKVVADGELTVSFIDVGQGDATLFVSKEAVILIDAGPGSATDDLMDALEDSGIDRIDCALFTHPHEDHIGGAARVIEKYKPAEILVPDAEANTRVFENMLDAIDLAGSKLTVAARGDKKQYGEISLDILSPEPGKRFDDDLNRSSLIIKLTYGGVSFMTCGDAEYYDENDVFDAYPSSFLKCDVLKVAHHGSGTASSYNFIKAVSPLYAVISCGRDNQYGHPHDSVLEKLGKIVPYIYRTDENGTVTLVTDGKNINAVTEMS